MVTARYVTLASGRAMRLGAYVKAWKSCLALPPEVRSQNADIWQDSMQAFRKVLIEAGLEKAIKKFWTYID